MNPVDPNRLRDFCAQVSIQVGVKTDDAALVADSLKLRQHPALKELKRSSILARLRFEMKHKTKDLGLLLPDDTLADLIKLGQETGVHFCLRQDHH